jgi:hypothetical protein
LEAFVDHPLPWLRYVDAGDLDDTSAFDGLQVESPSGEDLGDVNGFIVDSDSSRPLYVVIDSGGWFKSKYFLLPVGHARLDSDREALVASISRDRIERFPGVDLDNFDKLSDTELKRLNDDICQACSIEGVSITYAASEPYSAAWDRPDFRYPDWWHADPALPSRMGAAAVTSGATYGQSSSTSKTEGPNREQAVGRGSQDARQSEPRDGRAQPGDVIGVETGGERTYVGDTAEDENKRRQDAEEADARQRRDERK